MTRQLPLRPFVLAALIVSLAAPSSAFRLDSNFGVTATTPVNPRSGLPTRFIHWDLREFDNCTVPYSIDGAGCRDSLAGGGFDAIDRSFASWSAVVPTPLRFQRSVNAATNVAGNDNVSLMAFDSTNANAFMGAAPSGTLALTYVWVQAGTGRIQESDIIFNDRDWQWNNTGDDFNADTNTVAAPYNIGNGDSLYVRVDGGPVVGMRFDNTNITVGAATNQQVFNVITTAFPNRLYGFNTTSGGLKLQSRRADGHGSIEIVAGTGNLPAALAFPAGRVFTRLADIQTVCTHEIGHFMGIAHSSDNGGEPNATYRNAVMYAFAPNSGTKRPLTADDALAMNFLYTPDDGDAPPGYPTPVHTATNSRVLSGVQLKLPGRGPQHLFDYAAEDSLRFEWLGDTFDDATAECEARMVDGDLFDDGVLFVPFPMIKGVTNQVQVTVRYTDAARFDRTVAARTLYVNGYIDFDCDGSFDNGDREIWWRGDASNTLAASPTFTGATFNFVQKFITLYFDVVPSLASCGRFWSRFRVDLGEDEGRVANYNGDLGPAIGVAQFGEDEDYPIDAIDQPTPTLVARFVGEPSADGVILRWSTPEGAAPQVDVWRSANSQGEALVAQGIVPGPDGGRWVDTSVEPGVTYTYRLGLHDASGAISGPSVTVAVPELTLALTGLVPNPLVGPGRVDWSMPKAQHARLALYSVSGRLVRVLAEGDFRAGPQHMTFDGRGMDGSRLAPGIYFLRLDSGGRKMSVRAVIMQ